ncbi:hypothetical protein Acr_18g0009840 [Actinidia rufa]|uniref:Integrase catalytic domain-containing protein n=1 Tax=Actinidia rufa TaxID=165716 RepID=A0A7J0G7N5_9ERIC|nr:hypothetical protein Acr_18g0009840 [Actinidia rufa]
MHLRSRYLPRPSASSPPDNRAHPMANPGQVPDLEGLYREIHDIAEQMRIMNENNGRLMQLLTAANPPLPAAPPVPDIERSRHSNRSGDRSQNISTERVRRGRRRAPSPSLRERSSSSESSKTPSRARRRRSPRRGDHIEARNKSTSQKIRDLDARLDAINTRTNAPVIVDTLIRQTEPPFTKRVLRARISSKFKLPAQLGIYEGKTDPMDHLDSYKSLISLQGCSDEVMCKAFSATLKGPARSWTPTWFDSLSKNVSETLSALQSKADKYIAAEELAEAKRRRRGKDDHKRKEPDTRRIDYREETRYKRPDRDPKRSNDRRPRTPPRRPEGYLRKYVATRPPPNSPERRYGDNRPTAGDIQTIHGGFGSGGCSTSSRKKYARNALRPAEEEIYNLSSSYVGDQTPITFSNDDLRGLHLPHDDALVVSAVIANFNVQRILIDNGSSADILFISAFEKMKIGLDKLHPFHTPLIGFGGNTTHPLGWINLPITLGTEPHQITIWQDFIVVDCPSPYNAILGRSTLGGIKAITSTYHLKLKFPTPTGIGKIKGDQKVARQCFISAMKGDVPGIDPEIAMHKLFTNPQHSPVCQKQRKFAPERLKVIEDEVNKLIRAKVVREAHYPDWLANVVVAPKKGGKWRVCVDFIDLNKAGPKDSFPLPKIDLIVDATSKHELLSFYGRLLRISPDQNVPPDIEKTSFITKQGLYCYKVMPFGFVSKSVNKCLPFFKILRKSQIFQWNEESETAFQQLKEYLGSPPLLTVPTIGEDLYVYLSVSPTVVSAVLIREEDQVQKPIYYVSKVLMGAETRYPRIEKLAYALMIAARKLHHYFQAYPIIVLTDQPLEQILQRPDTSGRLLKWSIELSEFHIEYRPRIAIKAQALADFIVESTHEGTPQPETVPEMEISEEPTPEKNLAHWILFVDGSSNQHGRGAGLVIQTPSGEQMEYAIRIGFKATNNEAEYEALLAGDYLAKDARMMAYLGEVKAASAKIKEFKIHQIPREDNKKADALANLASTFEFLSDRCIPLEFLASPRIGVANQILQTEESPTWMDEIIAYLQRGTLPKDKLQARRLQYRSARFCIFKGRLYKRSFSGPLLKCLRPEEAEYVLKKIHEGICGNHSGARFGIPKVIISDNARQFTNDKFKLFCSDLAISHHFSSPGHPQANRQVEVTNRTILRNLKARLERSKSEWAEDLPSILWAYHTTSRIPTGETPYSMVFGTESVIPVEIGMPSIRTSNFDKESNEAELRLNLDLLEERREKAELRQAAYKCQVAKYYNQRVKHRSFLPGDLVLRRVTLSTKEPNAGKLGPTWEGPYKVIKVSRPGTYWLEDPNGKALLHPWNTEHLKKYYQ